RSGATREDLAAAGRIAGIRRVERTYDRQRLHGAAERHFALIELVDSGAAPVVDERDRNPLRTRRHAQTKAARIVDSNRRAVERDVELGTVAIDERARRIVPAGGGNGR